MRLTTGAEGRWLRAITTARPTLAPLDLLRPTRRDSDTNVAMLYGSLSVPVAGSAVWTTHPMTGEQLPSVHWTNLREVGTTSGDIKDLWELGRMAWLTSMLGDAEACWRHIESFARANPPFRGPQWMCGQESALRGIVLVTAAAALADAPATTSGRRDTVATLVAATVGRIRPTLGYALSQRNNHAISEAAFLWAAPALVDGLPSAARIRAEGARALREAIDDQWYDDGAYAQHSPTYQRLALHVLLFVLAVSRSSGDAPPAGVREVVARSARFLARIADPATGAVPNLGGNDGALLFDVAGSPIGDFRPVIVHAAAATGSPSPYVPGRWDAEALAFGLDVEHAPVQQRSDENGVAHHIHVGPSSRAVMKAGGLRHRPAHADQLHVDLWVGSTNVTADAGSFRYTAVPPWSNALADEAVHCSPRVPGTPQATRRGRFFWTAWAEARLVARLREPEIDVTLVELDVGGPRSLRRLLARLGDQHVIVDRTPPGAIVRWNLPADTVVTGATEDIRVHGAGWTGGFTGFTTGTTLVRSEDDPASGWVSPTYAMLAPVLALELTSAGLGISTFRPSDESPVAPAWLLRAIDVQDDAELDRLAGG